MASSARPVVTASAVVDAPPAVVFDILADPRQHPLIDGSGTVRGSTSGPPRLELGSTFGMDMRIGAPYKIRNKVVELEPDRLIAWRHVGLHRWRYELEELPADATGGTARTRVTETWDISRYPGLVQAAYHRAGVAAKIQRGIEKTLVKLSAAAEEAARKETT
ncbi:SRPBCC family protein [Nocardioides kribbensis]|uniref:SRPBCC family protein n=1 Tax=Nocardioides kribbensis TaxID=305517 RepID=UPI0032DB4B50